MNKLLRRHPGLLPAILFLLVCTGIAKAGVDVKEEPGMWELRDAEGSPVKDTKGNIRTSTYGECKLASVKAFGPALVEKLGYRCVTAVKLTVTGSCDPVTPPTEGGYTVMGATQEPLQCPDGVSFQIRERKWVVAYPKCGEFQDVVWRACGHVDPNVVALEDQHPTDPPLDESVWARVPNYAKLRGPLIETTGPQFYTPELAPDALEGEKL